MLRSSTNKVAISVQLPDSVEVTHSASRDRVILTAISELSIADAENRLLDAVKMIVESIDGVQLMVVS